MAHRSGTTRTVLQASSRAIQLWLIAGKYLVQGGAVLRKTLVIDSPDLDFVIPMHACEVVQNRKQWLNGPKKVSDFKRLQR
jgi:hypothetical protein